MLLSPIIHSFILVVTVSFVFSAKSDEGDCSPALDVAFLIDGSGSIDANAFSKMRDFLVMIVEGLSGESLVATVQYASNNKLEFDFDDYSSREAVIGALESLSQLRGGTRTGAALQFVFDNLLGASSGNRPGVNDVLIVLSDGKSTDQVAANALKLRQAGVLILAVGVGNNVEYDELISITGDKSLVFMVDSFSSLNQDLSERLMALTPSNCDPADDFLCDGLPDGRYENPFDRCSPVWFTCKDGERSKHHCNRGLRYDIDTNACHLPQYVPGCGGVQSTKKPVPTLPTLVFDCGSAGDGDFVNPDEPCSVLYVSCGGGFAYTRSCPIGLMFDSVSKSCQPKQFTEGCGGKPPPKPTVSDIVMVDPEVFNCADLDDGNFADPAKECSSTYYTCVGGAGFNRNCVAGTFFDAVTGLCLFRDYVTACGGAQTEAPEVTTHATEAPPFPFNCKGKKNGGYPHPVLECSPIFVLCSNENPIFLECPEGLNFDVKSQKCLHKDYILYCGGLPTTLGTTTPYTTAAPLFPFDCSDLGDGLYENPEACSPLFAFCSGGGAHFLQCSNLETMAYDIVSGRCLLKEHVGACGGISTSLGPIVTPGLPPFEFDCSGKPDGPYSDPDAPCSSNYAVCVSSGARYLRCFGPLKFDVESGRCLLDAYVQACGGTPTEPQVETSAATGAPVDFDCSGKEDKYYANPKNQCSPLFFSCVGGFPYQLKCASSTYFDLVSGDCLRKPHVEACGGVATTTTVLVPNIGDNTATPPPFDCWNLEDGRYPPPNINCPSFFYLCEQRETYRVDCPGSSKYQNGECVHPSQVSSCFAGNPGPFCEERTNGFYRSEQYCDQYTLCAEGVAFEFACLRGQVFDPETRQCKAKSEVYAPCGTKGPRNYQTCQHKKNGFYRLQDQCSIYCECRNEKKYILSCNEGYAYDSVSGYCIPALFVDGCGPPSDKFFLDFCIQTGKGGLYAHPNDCSKFVACLQDYPLVLDCENTFNKPHTPFWSDADKTCVVARPSTKQCKVKRSAALKKPVVKEAPGDADLPVGCEKDLRDSLKLAQIHLEADSERAAEDFNTIVQEASENFGLCNANNTNSSNCNANGIVVATKDLREAFRAAQKLPKDPVDGEFVVAVSVAIDGFLASLRNCSTAEGEEATRKRRQVLPVKTEAEGDAYLPSPGCKKDFLDAFALSQLKLAAGADRAEGDFKTDILAAANAYVICEAISCPEDPAEQYSSFLQAAEDELKNCQGEACKLFDAEAWAQLQLYALCYLNNEGKSGITGGDALEITDCKKGFSTLAEYVTCEVSNCRDNPAEKFSNIVVKAQKEFVKSCQENVASCDGLRQTLNQQIFFQLKLYATCSLAESLNSEDGARHRRSATNQRRSATNQRQFAAPIHHRAVRSNGNPHPLASF